MLVSSERDETAELERLCKKLQSQIDEERARLQEVEEKRQNELAFVENAFYTSNEEGMGVSPNSYEGQNRMPRPGHRAKTPPKDASVDQDDTLDNLEKSLDKIMPNHRVVKKSEKSQKSQKSQKSKTSQSPAHFGAPANNAPSETARSLDGVGSGVASAVGSGVGTGLKSKQGRKKGRPNQKKDEDKYEYYTSEDDQGRRIQKMRRKKKNAGASKERSADKRADRKVNTAQGFNQAGRDRSLTSQTQLQQEAISPAQPARRGSARGERSTLIRDTGANVMDQITPPKQGPRKTSQRRKKQAPIDYQGAYFKHTNFERAVIATNGRAPYNNKEVELITKPEGFDPNSKAFKNNWVNNLIKSGSKKSPRGHASNLTQTHMAATDMTGMERGHTPGQLSGIPSASVTATTVF